MPEKVTMLELTFFSIFPFPLYIAIFGSIVLSVGVFVKNLLESSVPDEPSLYYMESSLTTHILARCKLKNRPFCPNFWLSSKHAQTLLPVILPKPDVTYEREYLQMRDKGVVALDWVVSPHVKFKRKTTILLVFPPFNDGAVSMSAICQSACAKGLKTVVVNGRGHAGSVLTTSKLVSLGDPSDVRQIIKYLKMRMPKAPLAAIAYGSGCGLLMSYLGEFGSSALLAVGVCISPCYDAPSRISTNSYTLYDLFSMIRLKRLVVQHAKALVSILDIDTILTTWKISELVKAIYCPIYGYSDMEQFWEYNNPIRDVDDIAVPILCINSLDDPVCSGKDIPYDLFKCYPNFFLAVTKRGGHCGFLEEHPPKSWANSLSLDYVDAVIEFTTKPPSQTTSSSAKNLLSTRPRYHSVSSYWHSRGNSKSGTPFFNHRLNQTSHSNTMLANNHNNNSNNNTHSRHNSTSKRSITRFTI